MISLNRRSLLIASAASTVVAPARAAEKFIVTEAQHGVDTLPFYIAMRNGYFRDAGLDVALVTAEGGGRHISAVLSGDAQAFVGGPEHVAFARVKGGKEIKAVISMANRINAYVVAAKSVPVDPSAPLRDILKGRRIALGTRGSTAHSTMIYLLKRERLEPGTDVTLVEVGAVSGRMAAVRAGQADMALLSEPLIAQGQRAGLWGEPVVSLPKLFGPFAYTTLNVPADLIRSRPEQARALVAGTKKALDFAFGNPRETFDIARQEFPTLPADDMDAMLKRTTDDELWNRSGAMPEQAWAPLVAAIRGAGLLDRDVPYGDVFDPTILAGLA